MSKLNKEEKNQKKKKRQAFTLVELIVVITILAILGTIAFISFQGYSKNARDGVRIADLNNIKKSLELFIIEKGFYPTPDTPAQITYSGSIAWTQGIVGDTVTRNLQKLSEKPVDPLTQNEYTYSITNLKTEYQLGAMVEGGGGLLSQNTTKILPQTYAAEKKAVAMIAGTYNEKILRVQSGTIDYILAVPSIINSDINDIDLLSIINKKQLVYNNYTNLPDSYRNKGYTMTGGFDFTPSHDIVVYSGSTQDLTQDTNKLVFIDNLKQVYQNTIIQGEELYRDIINSDTTTQPTEAINLVNNYINTNVGGIGGGIVTQETNTPVAPLVCNEGEDGSTGVCKDPYWNNVTTLLSFEGNLGTNSYLDQKNNLTLSSDGSSILTGSVHKLGLASLYVPRDSSSWIAVNNAYTNFSNNNFTIEWWLYVPSSTTSIQLFETRPNGGNGSYITLGYYKSGANYLLEYYSNNVRIQSIQSILDGWHHIAYSRDTSRGRLFVDGVMIGDWGDTTTYVQGPGSFIGKNSWGAQSNGFYIDDFRITNGIARYITNFTPPVQTYANQ